jgi:hypothetical protein
MFWEYTRPKTQLELDSSLHLVQALRVTVIV